MEILKLKDGSIIPLMSGAFLDDLVFLAENEEDAIDICHRLTNENVSKIQFYHNAEDEEAYKFYEYLTLVDFPTRQDTEDERVIVRAKLRTQTDLEIRVSKIEEKLKNL